MLMPDKRDECGCHRGCEWLLHDCDNPCRWPTCLTAEEHGRLLDEIARDNGVVECTRSPTGSHERHTIADPMTGRSFVVCRHCGREDTDAA